MKKINLKIGLVLSVFLGFLIFTFVPSTYAEATEGLGCEKVQDYNTYNFDTDRLLIQGFPEDNGEKYYTKEDIILISSALECLKTDDKNFKDTFGSNKLYHETFSTTYANTVIKAFQAKRKLNVDGIIGIKTAFDMGFLVGQLNPDKNSKCSNVKIKYNPDQEGNETPFYSATSIPQSTEITSNRAQHKKNKKFLEIVINCLELKNDNENSIFDDDGDYMNPLGVKNSLEDLYFLDDDSNSLAGASLMFNLGRRFGEAGGKVKIKEYPDIPIYGEMEDDLLPDEKINGSYDPCEKYNLYAKNNNLTPNMEFDGRKWSLIPEAPGTFNWKDATLEEYLGGGRNTDDALYRYECLTGAGVIMSIIWKIEYLFESMLAVISVAMLLYGGYLYLVAGGEESLIDKATKSITWSIIGIVIVVTSRLIVSMLIPRQDNSVFYNEEELLTASSTLDGRESMIGIANFALGLVASIAVLMIIYGGYLYVISHGEESLETKAKTILAESIIGLIIIIIAYTLVSAIFGAANVGI